MKYLESYKSNKKTKINLNSRIVDFKNKFPTGTYMVFTCEDVDWKIRERGDVLYLGKIGNIVHVKQDTHDGDQIDSTYLQVLLFDFIMEIDIPLILFSTKEFNLDNNKNFKQILFTSNSLRDAQNKFDELKKQEPYSDWIIKQNIRKYNI